MRRIYDYCFKCNIMFPQEESCPKCGVHFTLSGKRIEPAQYNDIKKERKASKEKKFSFDVKGLYKDEPDA